jgi:two-component system CheB/CheR fusion protein
LDEDIERYAQLRDGAADTAPVPQIVVDAEGQLAVANAAARRLFGLTGVDIGRPIQELEISFRPIELRDPISRAVQQQKSIPLGRTQLRKDAKERTFEVQINPLNTTGEPLGVSVTYTDVTELVELDDRFEDSKRQLATAYEELQSTVEELETTNEELQSTNEELETMNEELQSTNDELEAMNDQQRERADEVDRLNLFLEGILGNLGVGVVVLDADQLVQVWNSSAGELWGLRGEEVVGKHFLGLDIGLPVERIRGEIRSVLEDGGSGSSVTIEAINRRGKQFPCEVRVLPLLDRTHSTYGVILLMAGTDGHVPAKAPRPTAGADDPS